MGSSKKSERSILVSAGPGNGVLGCYRDPWRNKPKIVILSEAKNLSWFAAKSTERFFASLRMTISGVFSSV
jgi:hypothetical protein